MITENGSIKVETNLDMRMQKQLNRNSFIVAVILTVIGAAGVAACLSWYIALIVLDKEETAAFAILVVFAAVLGGGIGIFVLIKKAQKTVAGLNKIAICEFFGNYFEVRETLNGEQVGKVKIYNNQITKGKETQDFMFFYVHASAAYPVCKDGLTHTELERLRELFKLKRNGRG